MKTLENKVDSLIETKKKYEKLSQEHEKLKNECEEIIIRMLEESLNNLNNPSPENETTNKKFERLVETKIHISDELIYEFIDKCLEEYNEKQHEKKFESLKLPHIKKNILTFIKEDAYNLTVENTSDFIYRQFKYEDIKGVYVSYYRSKHVNRDHVE
ncbi:3316_t:CDS:2, partial [Dentiscutata erythropus]